LPIFSPRNEEISVIGTICCEFFIACQRGRIQTINMCSAVRAVFYSCRVILGLPEVRDSCHSGA
jgi:hypothetical protein